MNKYMFFACFALFFSCTKQQSLTEQFAHPETATITSRTSGAIVDVNGNVESFTIIIEEIVLALTDLDKEISELDIVEYQSIDFVNLISGKIETFEGEVTEFNIIIEDIVVGLVFPGIDLSNHEPVAKQTLKFN